MNLKILLLIFIVCLTTSVSAQNSELLKGKWIFKEAYNKEKIDEAGQKTLKMQIINKMTFEFKNNGVYIAYAFGQNMIGNWSISNSSKTILLRTNEKEKFELSILELTKDRLGLKLGLGEFLMVKIKPN
jgi:hypothetical protein